MPTEVRGHGGLHVQKLRIDSLLQEIFAITIRKSGLDVPEGVSRSKVRSGWDAGGVLVMLVCSDQCVTDQVYKPSWYRFGQKPGL